MRIGIDARISRGWQTGVGRYTLSLLEWLPGLAAEHEFVLITSPAAPEPPLAPTSPVRRVCLADRPGSLAQMTLLPWRLRPLKLDLLFYTHPLSAMLAAPCPDVMVVLDLFPIHFPKAYPAGVAAYYRTMVRLVARRMRRLAAISEATKRDVVRFFGVAEERLVVTHLGVAPDFRPLASDLELPGRLMRYGISRPYVLYNGNKRPHKNVPNLVRAFAGAVAERGLPHALVITGREDPSEREGDFTRLRQAIAETGMAAKVLLAGSVADDDLPYVYSGADLCAVPSLYEGFGLPALEAMACGTVVLASSKGSLGEVLGEDYPTVDPLNVEAMAQAMAELLGNAELRASLERRGAERAASFTWERCARQTLALFAEVGGFACASIAKVSAAL